MKSIRLAALSTAAMLALPLAAHAQSATPWQGFYAGLNAGGIFSSTSTSRGLSGSGAGFTGGVQGGYNWMLGPVMLGGEIDFQGSTETSSLSGGPGFVNSTEAIPWYSTMRARVGYPVGRVMPYVTGGAVWGNQTVSGYNTSNGATFGSSNNFWTYTFGAGVEGQVAQGWTAKLEYLWIGSPRDDERSIGNVVRVGLNYHF